MKREWTDYIDMCINCFTAHFGTFVYAAGFPWLTWSPSLLVLPLKITFLVHTPILSKLFATAKFPISCEVAQEGRT